MSDTELSVRAGRNVGIEPSLLPWTRAAKGDPILVNEQGDTLLMVSTDKAARDLASGLPGVVGWFFSNPPPVLPKVFNLYFVDELGNEIPIGATAILTLPVQPMILFSVKVSTSGFCLAPGEKIIGRLENPPAPP